MLVQQSGQQYLPDFNRRRAGTGRLPEVNNGRYYPGTPRIPALESAGCPEQNPPLHRQRDAAAGSVPRHLREKLPQLQVEYFPEKPAEYRLNHPVGALLLSYAGSRFDRPDDTGAVIQSQTIQLCVTVVFRQLNGKKGAINVLDAVRRILGGHTPPGCRRRIWLTREVFIGEVRGLWQYALDFATESVFIEDSDLPSGPLLTEVNYEESE